MNQVYIAALLNGLYLPEWLKLDDGEQQLLKKAKILLGQSDQAPNLRALQAITGQVWEEDKQWYYKPDRLILDADSVLPKESPLTFDQNKIGEIRAEVENLRGLYPDLEKASAFSYSLYHTVYAWGARLAFEDNQPDVSVFDHNRLLAATVQCLQKGDGNFLLLKGAISGIQSFIYNDIGGEQIDDAKKASKRLRGRSFLVAHLCQAVAEHIVEELGLELANILFVGGGHFSLLLPNTKEVENQLIAIRKELNLGFYKNVGMQLSLLMSWVEVEPDSFFKNASAKYSEVTNELEYVKQKRHIDYLDEFFKVKGATRDYVDDEKLGTSVPYAEYLVEVKANKNTLDTINNSVPKNYKPAITILQFIEKQYHLFQSLDDVAKFLELKGSDILNSGGRVKFISINNTAFIPGSLQNYIGCGFNFIGKEAPKGKDVDKITDSVMLFEDIAKLSDIDKDLTYPQLAVMRLDVDDLGTLFAYGLGQNASFGRLSSLSREFQLFFGGYFNELAKKHKIYVTYSGGDDAFIIGSWLNVVLFAESLYEAFQEFSCENDHATFSAGIFTCSPFYPVVRFANDAADLLDEKAKKFGVTDTTIGKNAINLFGHTLHWDQFIDMMKFARDLEVVVPSETRENKAGEGKNIRRSMLQHLLKTIQLGHKDNTSFEFYRNIGRLHGLFARHGYGAKEMAKPNKAGAAKIIDRLLKESGDREHFPDFIIPLQYVLYKTRVVKQ